jgi:hypothetical protein
MEETFKRERKGFAVDLDQLSVKRVDLAAWRIAQLSTFILVVIYIGLVLLLLLTRRLFPPTQPPKPPTPQLERGQAG